ncbi:MAG: aspartate kinase [Candidatus Bathyarchaeia archaeon]
MVIFSVITFTVTGSNSPLSQQTNSSSTLQTLVGQSGLNSANSKRLVVKFGGSSLADRKRIEHAAHMISKESRKGTKLVVVVSAMGKMTDQLISLVNHSDKSDLDDVLAMGERTSIRIFAAALKAEGLDARYFDPSDAEWPIITDDEFSDANPMVELCVQNVQKHVLPLLDSGTIPVIAGFIGRSTKGRVSTIGRGGSDTTAFIIAKGIAANEVILVTDADGILSADPKIIPNAKKLEKIDVKTLIGLADSGTKFIHRKALRYKDADIPVRVIGHHKDDLDADGTVISGSISNEIEVTFASNSPTMSVTVAGRGISENPAIISELSQAIKENSMLNGLSADFDSIIFYAPQDSDTLLDKVHSAVTKHSEVVAIAVQRDLAFLRIKGVGLEDTPGIIGRISMLLRENRINIFGILTLASGILVFISWGDKEKAMNLMKQVITESF